MPKINALPPQTAPDGSDVFPTDDVSDSNKTKKLTLTALKEWFQSLADIVTTAMVTNGSITQVKLATTPGNGPLKSKIITFTRDGTAASGDVSYTGVGFMPSKIHFFMSVNGTLYKSDGFTDSTKTSSSIYQSAANVYWNSGSPVIYSNQSSWAQSSILKSFDADGFTLTWTKISSPTAGTMSIMAICER